VSVLEPLPRGAIKLLKEAIDEAAGWRGTLVGNPDPQPLEEFDSRIAAMRAALEAVRLQNAAVKRAVSLNKIALAAIVPH
jgi:hypothetical protein